MKKQDTEIMKHGRVFMENLNKSSEFGALLCPECSSDNVSASILYADEWFSEQHFLYTIRRRTRRCYCKDCGCEFKQYGNGQKINKNKKIVCLILLLTGSLIASIGIILAFTTKPIAGLLMLVVGLLIAISDIFVGTMDI